MGAAWHEGKAEGKTEGRVEGKAEGRVEGKAEMLRRQLSLKFGELPDSAAERIAIDTSVFIGMVRGSVRWRALVL